MSLIFLVSRGLLKYFVCDSGTRERKDEKHWSRTYFLQLHVLVFRLSFGDFGLLSQISARSMLENVFLPGIRRLEKVS
jgi:hypothetical protein